ncbi:hypothetical protein HPB52_002365 [Rhipicephalus sanguineus]|uniref:Uncharacterized protein n=1 Tax=Rhipicephalus sanguineus TaxID=34632 RepID=A0A9D4Q9V2_RHISA|nr:hypothetical protein HPB52_002365 [Rhipicephalus sanguineus]
MVQQRPKRAIFVLARNLERERRPPKTVVGASRPLIDRRRPRLTTSRPALRRWRTRKKESQRNIARDHRPAYGSRYSAAYVNPAFEPKEAMVEDDDNCSGYARVSSISCSSLHQGLYKPTSQKPCHLNGAPPRKYASTNSLAAELHEACRYQRGGGARDPARPVSHGFRHIEFNPESPRFGEQPPRYSTVVRESPLI